MDVQNLPNCFENQYEDHGRNLFGNAMTECRHGVTVTLYVIILSIVLHANLSAIFSK